MYLEENTTIPDTGCYENNNVYADGVCLRSDCHSLYKSLSCGVPEMHTTVLNSWQCTAEPV